jgi:hypothetical protein
MVDSLRAQGRFDEDIKIGHQLIPLIGETTRYNVSSPGGNFWKLRSQLHKNSGSMCDRTQLTHNKNLEVCKLFHQLGEMAWMVGNVNGGIQIMCRVPQISFKNGPPSQYSAFAFANLGVQRTFKVVVMRHLKKLIEKNVKECDDTRPVDIRAEDQSRR